MKRRILKQRKDGVKQRYWKKIAPAGAKKAAKQA